MKRYFLLAMLRGRLYQIKKRVLPKSYVTRKAYNGKKILTVEEGTKKLISLLENDEPILVGRFGTSECNTLVRYYYNKLFKKQGYGKWLDTITNNAGFFPKNESMVDRYCELVSDLYSELDLLCIMNSKGEDFIIKSCCPDTELTSLTVVDPLVTEWTSHLRGKKVLVIHPYERTIREQYKRRELLFPDKDILPEFELHTVKAVQTVADQSDDRFETWFEALDYMTNEAMKIDFDIALIGCGAYGLPLAARLKRNGKKAIHVGGCLQLLFGIRGERWDTRADYQKWFNDAWIRPDESEKPSGSEKVEGNCYW